MAHVDFPYGKKRNWEYDTADADIGLKSVPESCVIAHSLRQSRDKWLFHTFPKFTSKARGAKAPEPPPPHTIMSRGECDLTVGPHQFRQTTIYEVHYMQPMSNAPNLQLPSTSGTTASVSSFPVNGTRPSNTQTPVPTASGSPDDKDLSQLRLALGEGLEYTIAADLVARIHYEASVNPIFATKFRLAVDPKATPEQIRNFAFALPHLPGVKVSGVPTSLTLSTEQVRVPPIREWDLVIEFNEAPNERWLIPRGTLASCSRLVSKDSSNLPDVSLTLRLPVPQTQLKSTNSTEPNLSIEDSTSDTAPPRPVKLTLHRAPNVVYDLILKWIGGDDKNRENAAALAKIPKRQKVYLSHRLTQGALLTQLQAAQTPGYTRKPLKQTPSAPPRPRRKAAPKPKPMPQEAPASSGTPVEIQNGITQATGPLNQLPKAGKPPKAPKEPKRRRFQPFTKPATVIRCFICSKTDVPLMMGGRYCRECVDSGKATNTIPEVPHKPSQPSYYSTSSFAIPTTSFQPAPQPPSIANAPAVTAAPPGPAASSTPQFMPSITSVTPQSMSGTVAATIAENTIDKQSPPANNAT